VPERYSKLWSMLWALGAIVVMASLGAVVRLGWISREAINWIFFGLFCLSLLQIVLRRK
jgi:uncharacterized membrane protein YfcA